MSTYDPPEPPEPLHPCRWCDTEMVEDWPGYRGSEWYCPNPECEHSPMYKPAEPEEGRTG